MVRIKFSNLRILFFMVRILFSKYRILFSNLKNYNLRVTILFSKVRKEIFKQCLSEITPFYYIIKYTYLIKNILSLDN